MISRFASGSIVSGVFCILATVGWALEGLASLWMYKNVSPPPHSLLYRLSCSSRRANFVSRKARDRVELTSRSRPRYIRYGLTLMENKVTRSLKRNQKSRCTGSSSTSLVGNQRTYRQTRQLRRTSIEALGGTRDYGGRRKEKIDAKRLGLLFFLSEEFDFSILCPSFCFSILLCLSVCEAFVS